MRYDELMSKLFGFSVPTYYNWKKEKRAIIDLIEQSFSTQQIEDFLELGSFLCKPELLINEYNNKVLKFIDLIGISYTIMDSCGNNALEEGEKFLDVLTYTMKNFDSPSCECKTPYILKCMQRYYDDYKDLYNVNSWNLEEYNSEINELNLNNIEFNSLFCNDFKDLVYYAMSYKIKSFDLVLRFYLKYLFFNQKEKVNEIYEKIKPIYQNKKNNLYYDNMWYQDEKDVILIFNYELFKELVLTN